MESTTILVLKFAPLIPWGTTKETQDLRSSETWHVQSSSQLGTDFEAHKPASYLHRRTKCQKLNKSNFLFFQQILCVEKHDQSMVKRGERVFYHTLVWEKHRNPWWFSWDDEVGGLIDGDPGGKDEIDYRFRRYPNIRKWIPSPQKIFMNHMNCITLSVFWCFFPHSTGFMLSVCVV